MKTIFNKVDPKYLDCVSGMCEHAIHNLNFLSWMALFIVIGIFLGKKYIYK